MKDKVQLNKYDLVEWVVDIIGNYHILCRYCLFKCENESPKCWKKSLLKEEIIKKYNL
jgi:hypothetical protein